MRVCDQAEWSKLDADGTKAMELELKQFLEGMAQQVFGNVEARPSHQLLNA